MAWLEDGEYKIAHGVLVTNVINTAGGQVLAGKKVGTGFSTLILDNSFHVNTHTILMFCNHQPNPTPLIELLGLVSELPGIPPIISRLKAIVVSAAAAPAAVEPRLLGEKGAFLDRTNLRDAFRRLVLPGGPCVLKVSGPAKSGKSHTFRYLQQRSLEGHPITPFRVEKIATDFKATALANTLLKKINGKKVSEKEIQEYSTESAQQRAAFLAEKVLIAAANSKDNWWFVFDNFDDSALPEDTRLFLSQMALQIAEDVRYRRRFRVLLLNYCGELPAELQDLHEVDHLDPKSVDWKPEIRHYFAQFFDKRKHRHQPDGLDELADKAMAKLHGVDPEAFLPKLDDTLKELAGDF